MMAMMGSEVIPCQLPLVSIVIPSVMGLPVLAECIDSFLSMRDNNRAEILVLDRCGEQIRQVIRDRYPQVRLFPVGHGTSIPAIRALGIAHAKGQFIAFTEDHCMAQPSWLHAIERAATAGGQAVGGPVENACVDRLVDWAAFFCEYARFLPPIPEGPVSEISGNNCALARTLFEQLQPELQAEVWDSFLFMRLRQLGVVFNCDSRMTVRHKKSFGFWHFLSQRYHYSKSFAGMRLKGLAGWKRGLYAIATLALPLVLVIRIARTMWSKSAYHRQFLMSFPILFVFILAWAWGEMVGSLFGPGNSLEIVE